MKVILVLLKSGNLPHFSSGLKISEVPSTLPRVRCLEKVPSFSSSRVTTWKNVAKTSTATATPSCFPLQLSHAALQVSRSRNLI